MVVRREMGTYKAIRWESMSTRLCQGADRWTHVNVSPNPPSSPASLNLTPTAPLFPRYAGPHPVHEVCTSATRGNRSSRMYTNKATPTCTTLATREYLSLFGALASIWERMRELRFSITLLERPATRNEYISIVGCDTRGCGGRLTTEV